MEIKTICKAVTNDCNFDDRVNHYMSKGWKLTRRELIPSNNASFSYLFYAELVKENEKDQIKLSPEAIEAIERTRGTSSASDYANTAILVGIKRLEFMKGLIGRLEDDPAEED